MTAWTPEELAVVTDSGSLNLSAGDDGQPGVDIGMVAVGGELHVRAYRGSSVRAGTGQRVNTVARNVLLQIPAEIGPAALTSAVLKRAARR